MSNKKKLKFKDIIKRHQLTLIDFSAAWCGPCKAMEPVLKDLSSRVGDKAKIIKIDVDKNRNLSDKMQIRGVPTFMLFKKGKMLWRQSGMQSRNTLESLIEQHA
ncbi:MAG: thioredoxin [Saprospiraceae bacterium]|nr:thioredoxin [Saprospiraceae bacterium]